MNSRIPQSRLLNIGCGNHALPSWENIDFASELAFVQKHNLLDGIPYAEESFDAVYHSHVLEHFTKKDGEKLISECLRVLKPNGILRVVVPDLEQMARMYLTQLEKALSGDAAAADNREWMTIEFFDQANRDRTGGRMAEVLGQKQLPNWDFIKSRLGHEVIQLREILLKNQSECIPRPRLWSRARSWLRSMMRNELEDRKKRIGDFRLQGEVHLWMYDRFSLGCLLNSAGFESVTVVSGESSSIAGWDEYQSLDMINGRLRKPESLFVEGRKPAT